MQYSKQKLLLDINIVLDYIGRRDVGYEDARLLMLGGLVGEFSLWITSSQATDIVYILTHGGRKTEVSEVLESLRTMRRYVNIYAVTDHDIDAMLATTWPDPEDALLSEAAFQLKADAIITRDADFPGRDAINVFDCAGFFEWIEEEYGVSYAEVDV